MKKVLFLIAVFVICGFAIGCSSDSGGGSKSKDKITMQVSANPYSISTGIGVITLGVGVVYNGEPVHLEVGDIAWSIAGPNLGDLDPSTTFGSGALFTPNGTTGTVIIRAEYNELWSETSLNIVA